MHLSLILPRVPPGVYPAALESPLSFAGIGDKGTRESGPPRICHASSWENGVECCLDVAAVLAWNDEIVDI